MSDKTKGFIVSLAEDVSDEDKQKIQTALLCINGVCAVAPSIVTPDDWFNRSRVKQELVIKLFDILK